MKHSSTMTEALQSDGPHPELAGIGPVKGYVLPFIARQIGDEIVLEGNESGKSRKWIFSDITSE
jgi:hypothetical protein